MKLELDLKSRSKLESVRDDLRAALETVEFAISKLPAARDGIPEINLDFDSSGVVEKLSLTMRIGGAVNGMADRFKSSDVYNNIPDTPRSAIKDYFRKQVEAGRLKIIEQGEGSRPTIYEKTGAF